MLKIYEFIYIYLAHRYKSGLNALGIIYQSSNGSMEITSSGKKDNILKIEKIFNHESSDWSTSTNYFLPTSKNPC